MKKDLFSYGACMFFLLTGCLYDYSVRPDYYRGSLSIFHADDTGKAFDPDVFPDEIDVSDCIRFVLENNPDIQGIIADAKMAEYNVDIGLSYVIPKVKLQASNTFLEESIYELYGYDRKSLFRTTLSAQYLLYDFGLTRFLLHQRYYDTDTARARIKVASDELAFRAVQLFYSIKAMEQDSEAIGQSIMSLEVQFRDSESLFSRGRIPERQVLTMKVVLEELKYKKTALENSRKKMLISLKKIMGAPLEKNIILSVDPDNDPIAEIPASGILIETALQNRSEILSAQAAIMSAECGVDAAEAMKWPLFFISMNATYSDLEKEVLDDGVNMEANVTMTWDLYSGGEREANINIEREKLRKACLALKKAQDQVKEDVLIALSDIQELDSQETSLHAALASAEKNLRDIQSLYRNRRATASELVEAQAFLLTTQSNLNKARYSCFTALYALEKSIGISLGKKEEGRRQKTVNREEKTEDRRQKTERQGPQTED